jgi:hypothetical protein
MEAVIDWNGKSFKKMVNLKTLIIKGGHFLKCSQHFPRGLRVLEWQRYPLECIPFSFLNKVSEINSFFCRAYLQTCNKIINLIFCLFMQTFEKMTILRFDNCNYLTDIPNISNLPNLEKISFKNCKNLITIHDSIGFLSKLQILNAEGCDKLLSFPPLKLISLVELKLSDCTSLTSFPEILIGKDDKYKSDYFYKPWHRRTSILISKSYGTICLINTWKWKA